MWFTYVSCIYMVEVRNYISADMSVVERGTTKADKLW